MPLHVPPVAVPGQKITDIQTPALLIDLDAFDDNVRQMANVARLHGVALRPHAKAHKCSAVALAQQASGAVGICCQKLSEAYPFVNAGIHDIHISNQFVGPPKIAMAVELARHARLSVCVDHPEQVTQLGVAAAEAGVIITVLPEIDIGQGRCGVGSDEALLALYQKINHYPSLCFGGLQAYHGGIQHVCGWGSRKRYASHAATTTAHYVDFLAGHGISCPVVTGGGTGTAEFDAASGVYTELQPGSYVFMDAHYGANNWEGSLRLRHSLFIASTIMSTAREGRAICDVGLKGVALDSGLPEVSSSPHASQFSYVGANDEHGILMMNRSNSMQPCPDPLGECLLLIPGHCDPTCNLYAQYVAVREGIVEHVWEIDARGLSL